MPVDGPIPYPREGAMAAAGVVADRVSLLSMTDDDASSSAVSAAAASCLSPSKEEDGSQLALRLPSQASAALDDISLLLSVEQKPGSAHEVTKSRMQVFGGETIRDLKIQLRKREFFTNKHTLVFGDRKLLEDETVGRLASSGKDKFLHVVAKLSDIERMEVTTDKKKSVMNNSDRLAPMSALSPLMMNGVGRTDPIARCPLLLCGGTDDRRAKCTKPPPIAADPVLHLIIKKSSTVHWHHLKGERFELEISAAATVDEVKRKIEEVSVGFQPDDHALVKAGHTLQHDMSLSELGVKKGDVLEVVEVPLRLEEYPDSDTPKLASPKKDMSVEWQKAKDALANGVRPKLASAGTGGSYFISAVEGMNLAVFKPEDEEPRAPNNPKGHKGSPTGEGLRRGTRPGEGATREVIAFILDHDHFSGVPPTAMASLSEMHSSSAHRKVGSFQQFVQHDMDCEEMGPSRFPVRQVHKICVLDIRLANADRNGGNILARQEKGEWNLTPIDHGYCLPDSFEDINFEWMYWPQAKVPFDEATGEYISRLDAKKDLETLTSNGLHLRDACARVFRVCTMLLQKSLSHGLTPYEIGMIMCRQTLKMSPLEKLHKRALQLSLGKTYGVDSKAGAVVVGSSERLTVDDDIYLETMSAVLDQYLEETRSLENDLF